MGIAAAIIAGVIGVGSAIGGGIARSKAEERAQAVYDEEKRKEEELFRKERKLKERQQSLSGLDYLAQQRQQATMYDSSRSFNRDALAALNKIRGASGVTPPAAPSINTPGGMQGSRMAAAPAASPPRAATAPQPLQTGFRQTQPSQQGLGYSTIGRRAA